MEEDALVAPRLVERELAAVEARGIVVVLVGLRPALHGLWRIVLEGIADVGIDGPSVARHLPGERHADGLPLAGDIVGRLFEVLGVELAGCRSARCALDIAETPLLAVLATVEASHQRACLVGGQPRGVVVGSVCTELLRGGIGQEGGMGSLLVVLKLLWVAGPGGDVVCLAHIDIVYQAHALADGTAAGFSLGATDLDSGRRGGEQGRDSRAGSLLQYAVDIEAILGQMDGENLRVVIKLHVQLGLRIESLVDPAGAESLAEFLSTAGSVGQLVGGWDIIKVEVVAPPVLYLLSEGDDVLQGGGASGDVEDYLQALL